MSHSRRILEGGFQVRARNLASYESVELVLTIVCTVRTIQNQSLLKQNKKQKTHIQQNTINTMMPRARRPRRSFGGKDGVWWRKKTLRPLTELEFDDTTDSPPNIAATTNVEISDAEAAKPTTPANTLEIGWDDDLCRPIYHKNSNNNVVSDGALELESSSSEDNESSPEKEETTASSSSSSFPKYKNHVKTTTTTTALPVKRKKTYGNKKPRPLSLLLLESNLASSPILVTSPDQKKTRKEEEEEESPVQILFAPFTDQSPGNKEESVVVIPRRVSTSPGIPKPLLLQDDNHNATRTKEENDDDEEEDDDDSSNSPGSPKTTSTLEFTTDETPNHITTKRNIKHKDRLNANTSILKAQEYFRDLDATEKLKLDSSDSPALTSKVIRTKRKVHLDSPGITREYQEYTNAMTDSDLTPLPVQEYVRGRSDFFRNGELFDGFLDD